MWKILIGEFWNDLRTQRTRAFLTMFAITWGTIAVVLLLSFGEGLKNTLVGGLLNAGDRILIVYGGQTTRAFEGLPQGRSIRLVEEDLDLLMRSIPAIDLASPSYGRYVSVKHGKERTNTFMEGVHVDFEEMRRMFPVTGGRFLNQLDIEQKRRVVFLGGEIAERLFGEADPIGETVQIDNLPFVVIGIMGSKTQTSMNNGPDANRAIIPASTFQATYGHRFVNSLIVRPRDVSSAGGLKREIFEVLGRRYKFDPDDPRALSVWDFIENERETSMIFLGIQIFLGVIGGLTLLVAGVGVANIMYVVVRERTKEIGIKRSMGARRKHIMSQIVFEALIISLSGGFVGLGVSALVVAAVSSIPEKEGAMEYLTYASLNTDTPEERRRGLTEMIKLGLVPYVAQTPLASRISLTYEEPRQSRPEPIDDPWSSWVFDVYNGGNFNLEATRSTVNLRYGASGDRVTEEWKTRSRVYFNYNERTFRRDDGDIQSIQHNNGASANVVKSMGNHLSAGMFSSYSTSTFNNINHRIGFGPALEYSLFPYREASRKDISLTYRLGYSYTEYLEQTIFGRDEETLFNQSLNASVRIRQPWGSVFAGLTGSHFFHDLSSNRLQFFSNLSFRLVRGLSLNISGDFEMIHDLLSLPKGEASLEDLLLQQRRLATTYSTSGSVGLSYTFGSMFSNVVNTRL